MIINHNLSALNTYNQYSKNNNALSNSLEKLSSGYRINDAADDAAGLAISEKMRSQIRGLDQAKSNAQNGISMLDTAEGALSETEDILQRMRELAVQASSDEITDEDRNNIQQEMDQLVEEIDRIAETTEFNTKKLLDGSMGAAVATATQNVSSNTALDSATTTATLLTALQDADGNSLGIEEGDTITINYMMNGELQTQTVSVTSATTVEDLQVASDYTLAMNGDALEATAATAGTTTAVYGLNMTVTDSEGDVKDTPTSALSAFTQTTAAQDKRKDGSATILIGANTGQTITIDINSMDSGSLGVRGLQVSSTGAADVALEVIDTAIASVSSERGKMGALQNRLDHTINNLSTSSENLTAAESRIRDVDMASEMATYTKLSVLSQASTAMLAQANQLPQNVLSLLQ